MNTLTIQRLNTLAWYPRLEYLIAKSLNLAVDEVPWKQFDNLHPTMMTNTVARVFQHIQPRISNEHAVEAFYTQIRHNLATLSQNAVLEEIPSIINTCKTHCALLLATGLAIQHTFLDTTSPNATLDDAKAMCEQLKTLRNALQDGNYMFEWSYGLSLGNQTIHMEAPSPATMYQMHCVHPLFKVLCVFPEKTHTLASLQPGWTLEQCLALQIFHKLVHLT